MTIRFDELPAWDEGYGLLNVVVDTPRGSRNKYTYDEEAGLWRLSKVLPLGASFPHDFGFIPTTRGGDGDPLDILDSNGHSELSRLRVDRPTDRCT
jgi:inorganic pyrophosphatase